MRPTECGVIVTAALAPFALACGLFPEPAHEEVFQEAIVAAWVAEGATFMGKYGTGPIAVVAETGERVWSVEYPEDGVIGGNATGQLRVTELAAYPIFAGEAFARRLQESALEVDRRGGLTQEAWRAVSRGEFAAIGYVRAEVTRSTRPGRESVEQYAVLPTASEGVEASWEFRDGTRSMTSLWRATHGFYDRMMMSDDRVMECAKSIDPSSNRALFLECATMLLEEEFGG